MKRRGGGDHSFRTKSSKMSQKNPITTQKKEGIIGSLWGEREFESHCAPINSKRQKLYVNKGGMSTGSITLCKNIPLNKLVWVWVCSIPSNNPLVYLELKTSKEEPHRGTNNYYNNHHHGMTPPLLPCGIMFNHKKRRSFGDCNQLATSVWPKLRLQSQLIIPLSSIT